MNTDIKTLSTEELENISGGSVGQVVCKLIGIATIATVVIGGCALIMKNEAHTRVTGKSLWEEGVQYFVNKENEAKNKKA